MIEAHHDMHDRLIRSDDPFHLDPRSLLVFRQVCRSGSLSGAAEVLGWTQPAVSQHVRKLERVLRIPLALRQGRGIEITEAGRALAQHGDTIAVALDDAVKQMNDYAQVQTGTVRVAAFPSASATIASDCVMLMSSQAPGIEVRLTQLEPPEAITALQAGECDIALVFDYQSAPLSFPGTVEQIPLLEDPLRVILSQFHPLSSKVEVSLGDLSDQQWVGGCPNCRQHLLDSAALEGFHPDIRHSTDDYVVVQSLVASNIAVSMLPGLALKASRNPAVSDHPVPGHAPRRVFALVRHNARRVQAVSETVTTLVAVTEKYR